MTLLTMGQPCFPNKYLILQKHRNNNNNKDGNHDNSNGTHFIQPSITVRWVPELNVCDLFQTSDFPVIQPLLQEYMEAVEKLFLNPL